MSNPDNTQQQRLHTMNVGQELIDLALVRLGRPDAASALLIAATSILVADLGEFEAIELIHSILDEAAAQWRAGKSAIIH